MNAPVISRLKAAVFKSNRSQAVRIPKAAAFPDDVKEVWVLKEGKSLRLVPLGSLWDDFFAEPGIDIHEPEDPVDDTPPLRFD